MLVQGQTKAGADGRIGKFLAKCMSEDSAFVCPTGLEQYDAAIGAIYDRQRETYSHLLPITEERLKVNCTPFSLLFSPSILLSHEAIRRSRDNRCSSCSERPMLMSPYSSHFKTEAQCPKDAYHHLAESHLMQSG